MHCAGATPDTNSSGNTFPVVNWNSWWWSWQQLMTSPNATRSIFYNPWLGDATMAWSLWGFDLQLLQSSSLFGHTNSSGKTPPAELMTCRLVVLKPFDDFFECDGVQSLYLQFGSCTYTILHSVAKLGFLPSSGLVLHNVLSDPNFHESNLFPIPFPRYSAILETKFWKVILRIGYTGPVFPALATSYNVTFGQWRSFWMFAIPSHTRPDFAFLWLGSGFSAHNWITCWWWHTMENAILAWLG